jgi:hypothetical protein
MRQIRVARDGAPAAGLGIIHVSADYDYLQLPLGCLRFIRAICHQQRHGRPG